MVQTRHILCPPDALDVGAIEAAAAAVDQGRLVAFPTETVYGIACRVEPEALARLSALKGRAPDKRYTLHVGSPEALAEYVPQLEPRIEVLLQRAWPGPLTVVFSLTLVDLDRQREHLAPEVFTALYTGGTLGVRCPDHPVAERFLQTAQCPVVAPSANPAGAEPAVQAEEVAGYFDGQIDMILDGGPCPLRQSSTVVQIEGRDCRVLRQGAISPKLLRKIMIMQILFVCTGNTCRSAMAEGIAKQRLAQKLGCIIDGLDKMGYKIRSAGTMNVAGVPASEGATAAAAERGVDLSGHLSSALTDGLIEQSDLILAMEDRHLQQVLRQCPDAADRSLLLKPQGIADPVGQPLEVFRRCAEQIDQAIEQQIDERIL